MTRIAWRTAMPRPALRGIGNRANLCLMRHRGDDRPVTPMVLLA
jgi:hypothetical protein